MKIRTSIYGIEESITRPIALSVTKDILGMLGVSKDTFTTYDENERSYRVKHKIDKLDTTRVDTTNLESRAVVSYHEEPEDGFELSMLHRNPDTYPIYQDTDVPAYIQTIQQKTKMIIELSYYTKSKSAAEGIVNKLRILPSLDGYYRFHSLEYSFAIPHFALRLISHFNHLKNLRLSKEEQLSDDDYLRKYTDNRIVVSPALNNDTFTSSFFIREAQVHTEGYITTDLNTIKPEKNDDDGTWVVQIEYTFTYEKPTNLLMEYPIMVWNTPINNEFKTFEEIDNVTNRGSYLRSVDGLFKSMTKHPASKLRPFGEYFTIPIEDSRVELMNNNIYTRVAVIRLQVDDENPTFICNINDIPIIKFKDSVKDFLINSEYKYVGMNYKSFFLFTLIEGDLNAKEYKNMVVMDNDGNIYSNRPMDLKKSYRLGIYFIRDTSYIMLQDKKRVISWLDKEVESYKGNNDYLLYLNNKTDLACKRYETESYSDIYLHLLDIDYNDVVPNILAMSYNIMIDKPHTMKATAIFSKEAYKYDNNFLNEILVKNSLAYAREVERLDTTNKIKG